MLLLNQKTDTWQYFPFHAAASRPPPRAVQCHGSLAGRAGVRGGALVHLGAALCGVTSASLLNSCDPHVARASGTLLVHINLSLIHVSLMPLQCSHFHKSCVSLFHMVHRSWCMPRGLTSIHISV